MQAWTEAFTSCLTSSNGLVQYQPAGNNRTLLSHTALTELSSQFQPAGNSSRIQPPTQYLSAGEGNFQTATAACQLTHPIFRDDDIDVHAAHPHARHLSPTPIHAEGAGSGWSARNPRPTNANVQPAPCVASRPTVNHDCNSGATAKLIALGFMPCASMVELPMIMSYTQSSPLIKTLLPASAIASSMLLLTLRLSCLSLRARTRPPQQSQQTTSQPFMAVRKPLRFGEEITNF